MSGEVSTHLVAAGPGSGWEICLSDPRMTDREYPTLVERYLGADEGSVDPAQLAHCPKPYASANLGPLGEFVAHGTMNRLGCPQLSDCSLER